MKHPLSIMALFVCTAHLSHAMETTPQNHLKSSYATQVCRDGIDENDLNKVQLSLILGANVNHLDKYGQSLLYCACLWDNKNIITELLNQDNINVATCLPEANITPLHIACQNNQSTAVLYILSKDHNAAIMCDDNGSIPLHTAAYCRKKKCIKLLLAARPDTINTQNDDKETPLHLVCKNKEIESVKKTLSIIKLLISCGADTTIKNSSKATPLLCLFDLLHPYDEFDSFMEENVTIATKMIEAKDTLNNNQLHLCAKQQHLDATLFKQYVSFLILNGLDVQSKNDDAKKPVDIARRTSKILQEISRTYLSLNPNKASEVLIEENVSEELEKNINLQECIVNIFVDLAQ